MGFFNFAKSVLRKARMSVELAAIRISVKHLHGPRTVKYGINEVIVLCVVRDGADYIKSFIKHYLTLGAKHIVFLDNNSEDATVALAKAHEHVTVISSRISIRSEFGMKKYLVNRFCKRRWCLVVDIDEFFDYPFSGILPVNGLLKYLTERSFTAVVTQMLDMFSEKPLDRLEHTATDYIPDIYRYYDISDVEKHDYFFKKALHLLKHNATSNENIKFYTGGIRNKMFGTDNWITKHQLIFAEVVRLTNPHCVSKAKCADFSAVSLHYKFIKSFFRIIQGYIEKNFGATGEYLAIISKLQKEPSLILKLDTARELKSVDELVENGFLAVSPEYRGFVQKFVGQK